VVKRNSEDPSSYCVLKQVDGVWEGSSEATHLYLFYLFLSMREYSKAFHYLEQIPPHNQYAGKEWKTLDTILQWIAKVNDGSVEAEALFLHSYVLWREHKQATLQEIDIKQDHPLVSAYQSYLESSNHCPAYLELSPLEEAKWRKVLPKNGLRNPLRINSHAEKYLLEGREISSYNGNLGDYPWGCSGKRIDLSDPVHEISLYQENFSSCFFSQYSTISRTFRSLYSALREGDVKTRERIEYLLFLRHHKYSSVLSHLLSLVCRMKDPSSLPEVNVKKDNLREIIRAILDTWQQDTKPIQHASRSASVRITSSTSSPFQELRWIEKPSYTQEKSFLIPLMQNPALSKMREVALKTLQKIQCVVPKIFRALATFYRFCKKALPSLKALPSFLTMKKSTTPKFKAKIEAPSPTKGEIPKLWEKMLETLILSKSYPEAAGGQEEQKQAAAILTGVYPLNRDLPTLIKQLLDGSQKAFLQMDPRYTKKDIDELKDLLHNFLIAATAPTQENGRTYPTSWQAGLAFEYLSKQTLRPKQAQYLQKILARDSSLLGHLIMGEGKTSVIASLLGKLWADGEHIALFLTPMSQWEGAKNNLETTQWRYFKQEVAAFHYTREELSLPVLKNICEALLTAQKERRLVVLASEMPQILELEFISLLHQPNSDSQKIEKLQEILQLLRTKTKVIIDEADEVLRIDREVNFPSGETERIDPKKIRQVADLYKILGATPETKLLQNEQEELSEEVYRSIVLPKLGSALVQNPKYPEEHKSALLRFFIGQTPSKEDAACALWQDVMGKENKELADEMGLMRHMLQDILPCTLKKKTKRDYGRLKPSVGKVVPYVAANTPGTTEYGEPWEQLAYHFQTALSTEIEKSLFDTFAERILETLEYEAKTLLMPVQETQGALDLERNFGFLYTELETKEGKEKARVGIQSEMQKRLRFEEYIIQQEVSIDPAYFSSNSHNALMFPHVFAMTGTPYNRDSYPRILGENPILDLAAEKKLEDTLIQKNSKIVSVPNPSNLTEVFAACAQEKKVRALIDIGGNLIHKSNQEYALEILQGLPEEIKAIVFFQKQEGSEQSKLMLYKRGGKEPTSLPNTLASTWENLGIDPNNLFFLYDQWHARGTDFPLPQDATAIALLGLRDPLHNILQGAARLRKLHLEQQIAYVVPPQLAYLKDTQELLEKSRLVEQKLLKMDVFRHYTQEIHNVYRNAHLEELLQSYYPKWEYIQDLLQQRLPKSLYQAFGKVAPDISPLLALESQARMFSEKYSGRFPEAASISQEILAQAKERLETMPTQVSGSSYASNREQKIQVQKEEQKEVETDYQKELEQEWNRHQEHNNHDKVVKETSWTINQADALSLQRGKVLYTSHQPLSKVLADYKYQRPISLLFDSNLYATKNWHTCVQRALPIFSKKHKPATQLLIIEHGNTVSGLLLSLAESEFFRSNYLKQSENKKMWLIDPAGHLLCPSKDPLPDSPAVQRLLLQANVLNGNLDWLIRNADMTRGYLEENPALTAHKRHFLYLQAHRTLTKAQIHHLLHHPLLGSPGVV